MFAVFMFTLAFSECAYYVNKTFCLLTHYNERWFGGEQHMGTLFKCKLPACVGVDVFGLFCN